MRNFRFLCLVELVALGLILSAVPSMSMAADRPYMTTTHVSFFADEGLETPIIDGFIDDAEWRFSPQSSGASGSLFNVRWDPNWDDVDVLQTGLVESIKPDEAPFDVNDCSFFVYTVYDDEYLYLAVRVLDDWVEVNDAAAGSEDQATWYDDSVEIFIDGDYSQFDTPLTSASADDQAREFATGGQFVMTANGARRDNEAGNPTFGENDEWYGVAEQTDTGYEVEMKIKLSKIGNPTKGSKIGFNVAVNDDDDGDQGRYQLRWSGEAHRESTYGTLYFGPREVTAPLVDGPITIDGVMDEADWAKAAVETITPQEGVVMANQVPNSADDLSYVASIMHDDTWLYVGVVAKDDQIITDTEPEGSHNANTWHDDSIEVFIDHDLNHGEDDGGNRYASPDMVEGQYVLTAGNATRDSNTSPAGGVFIGQSDDDDWWCWATIVDDNTWVGEMRFKKETLCSVERVGFNLAMNDDDDDVFGAEPDTQLRWQGTPHVESSYGVLILGGAPVSVRDWMIH